MLYAVEILGFHAWEPTSQVTWRELLQGGRGRSQVKEKFYPKRASSLNIMGVPVAHGKDPVCQSRRWRPGFDPWFRRRAWQPLLGFLSRESHGERSLTSYCP